jgi:hypothetical protein
MEVFAIVSGVLVLLGLVFFLLGWIVPLVIGLKWRRRGQAGAAGWSIFAGAWGAVALVVAGALALVMVPWFGGVSSRHSTAGAEPFNAAGYSGATGTLKPAFGGVCRLVGSVAPCGRKVFAASNGVIVVPAGTLALESFEAEARDAGGRTWTARTRECRGSNVVVGAGSTLALGLGPPLRAAARVTWAAVSDEISITPVYFDAAGNEYSVQCSGPGGRAVPWFEFLDGAGAVVWSNSFEFG